MLLTIDPLTWLHAFSASVGVARNNTLGRSAAKEAEGIFNKGGIIR
jgi:hypothetical protein